MRHVVFEKEYIPGSPFDYDRFRYAGSHLLRVCALCGKELTFCGETASEADCTPHYKQHDRDRRLDIDDHDRCQC